MATDPTTNTINIEPHERQMDVLRRIYACPPGWKCMVGYGGTIGAGKSRLIALASFILGVKVWPGSRILIGRNELLPLESTTIKYFLDNIQLPPEVMKHNQQDRIISIRNLPGWPKDLVTEIHYHPLADEEKVQGLEYNIIFVDEANGISQTTAGYLQGRLRHRIKYPELAMTPQRQVFLCASNPHPGWYTDWFWKGELQHEADGSVIPGIVKMFTDKDRAWSFPSADTEVHFVRALPQDNPHLPKNYLAQATLGMDPGLAKRFIEGRFDVFDGAVFTEFRPASVTTGSPPGHIWDYPEMPKYTSVIGGIDLGGEAASAHYTTGVVGAKTESGRIIIVAEFKDRGPGVKFRLAEWIAKVEREWGRPIHRSISWIASKDQKWSLEYLARGASIVIRPNRGTFDARETNVAKIQDLFMNNLIFIRPECRGLIEELRNYVYDKKAMEKEGKVKFLRKNDDLVDALQYLIEQESKPVGDPMQMFKGMYAPMR